MNNNVNSLGFELLTGAAIGLAVIGGATLFVDWLGRKVSRLKDSKTIIKAQAQFSKLITEEQLTTPDLKNKPLIVQSSSSESTFAPRGSSSTGLLQKTAIEHEVLRIDEQYGKVEISSFSPTWLQDYPQIIEHIESEHLLHVKGKDENEVGLTWHTEKFTTDMEPRLNPEAKVGSALRGGFQMKLGYFLVPESKMKSYAALALSSQVVRDIKVNVDDIENYYRFFVHPEAYDHFRVMHQDEEIKYVNPETSEFIGTPTSSYRSWVVRRVEQDSENSNILLPGKNSVPFVVKLGVAGSVLGSDRWLSPNEIERSVQAQIAFDLMPADHFKKGNGSDLFIFAENLGLVLQNVPGYPKMNQQSDSIVKESGLLIREFPKKFLEGKCKIVSMAALMSPERVKQENHGIGLSSIEIGNQGLPLIFDVMAATIKAGHVQTPQEFIERYLVKGYLSAIENVVFQEGLTLEPHSQNLCMVLNNDLTPKGFAYRDHGGIWIDIATRGLQDKDISPFYRVKGDGNKLFKTKGAIAKGYIGSYAWFYRYQVVIKMLNMITRMQADEELMSPPTGAPYQIGKSEKLPERNLQKYIIRKIETEYDTDIKKVALQTLKRFSLDMQAYQEIINLLDHSYLELMNRYFDLPKIGIQLEDGSLPSAEGGSPEEKVLYQHKGFLGKYRFQRISSQFTRVAMAEMPEEVLNRVRERVITSFENQSFDDVQPTEWMVTNRGLCFFDKEQNIVAFMPFSYEEEKVWVEKQLRD